LQTPKGTKVATSASEVTDNEKKLIELRDSGLSWTKTTDAYNALLLEDKVSRSTVVYRYTALKANLTGIADEDRVLLPEVKKEVEDAMEKEKWGRIAELLEKKGGGKYPVSRMDSIPS